VLKTLKINWILINKNIVIKRHSNYKYIDFKPRDQMIIVHLRRLTLLNKILIYKLLLNHLVKEEFNKRIKL
jgi:hypothetical protein